MQTYARLDLGFARRQIVRGNCEPDAVCGRKGVDFEALAPTPWTNTFGASVLLCTGALMANCAELEWRTGTGTALMRGRRRDSKKACSRATSHTAD